MRKQQTKFVIGNGAICKITDTGLEAGDKENCVVIEENGEEENGETEENQVERQELYEAED